MTKRLALVAHYDPRGEAAPHVLRQLDELGSQFDEVVLATTVDLSPTAASAISSRATLIRRANYGHDFGSWRDCLERFDWAQSYDEVLLTNDSYIGFFRPLGEIMQTMSTRPVELWGMTRTNRVAPHAQSYFLHFAQPALRSQAFRRFWVDAKPAPDRMSAILQQEVGISRAMTDAGFAIGSYFEPTTAERLRANRRGAHWLHRRQQVFHARFDRARDGYFDSTRRRDPRQADNLNWSSAFADSTLDRGRLPIIKIDVLRNDPYWLDSRSLLADLEKKYPVQMEGVSEFLRETRSSYGNRPFENHAPARLTPLQKVTVGYRPPHIKESKGTQHVFDA